jgi:hypothetical protein
MVDEETIEIIERMEQRQISDSEALNDEMERFFPTRY